MAYSPHVVADRQTLPGHVQLVATAFLAVSAGVLLGVGVSTRATSLYATTSGLATPVVVHARYVQPILAV